jgi:hypothetical protein
VRGPLTSPLIAVVLPLALAVAGCGGGGDGDGAKPGASTRAATGGPSGPGGVTAPTGAAPDPAAGPPPSPAQANVAAVTVVHAYTRALHAEDVGGLQATLAPAVRIRAAGPGGACVSSDGSAAAVSAYAAQFSSPSPRYAFAAVSRKGVRVRGGRASATVVQRRPRLPRAARRIHVGLAREGSTWRVARVTSTCKGGEAPVPGKQRPGAGGVPSGNPTPTHPARPNVVHPRRGCTVVLDPQESGNDGKRPDPKALQRLCDAGVH